MSDEQVEEKQEDDEVSSQFSFKSGNSEEQAPENNSDMDSKLEEQMLLTAPIPVERASDNEPRLKLNFSPLSMDTQFMSETMNQTVAGLRTKYIGKRNPLGLIYVPDDLNPRLKVFNMTWNMQGRGVPSVEDFKKWIPLSTHHIYCFGTQECERSIEASMINPSKQAWETMLLEVMGSKYVMIKNQTMMAIHIAVFVRKELQPLLSEVFSCNVATGFADRVGNKGSVSISFSIRGTTLLFINSHLPAHQGKIEDRNNSYHRIMAETKFRKEASTPTTPSNASKEENRGPVTSYPIQEQFRVIFFMGDMNYRVNGNRRVVDKLIETEMIDVLLANDQLSIERNRGNVFIGFIEGEISFYPTYKFSKNSDIYDDSKKQRIPAWTDRILWSSKDSVELIEYNSMKTVRMSDHRPVYGSFLVKLDADPNEFVLDDVQETTTAQSNVCTIQ